MKATAAWFRLSPCLLVLGGMLTACDATKWPLADYQSPWPPARQTAHRWTADSVPSRQKPARPAAAAPAPANATGNTSGNPLVASAVDSVPATTDAALIGLDSEQTRAMLGPPREEENRSPAKIWRYRTPQCSLDVAFYPDVQTHEFRVLNYEVKGNDGTEQGRRDCIAGLRSGLRPR
ncbi:MAG: hypothetical protein OJJ21_19850 [Ferrovibrio sp.]|uniref:hypothetical protein n=1 Tax=Ferrovibrio sp. TaxID=1917215 RepID=UPI002618BFA4|nr:hypothetical protein [Ferrovibrio sp.]MCW0235861.1 hypothetical protein [Ferrovibrio sp.]